MDFSSLISESGFNSKLDVKAAISFIAVKKCATLTWVLSDSSLDDISNVFQSRSKLLELVVTQRNIVGQVWLVSKNLHGCGELLA